MLNEQLHFHFKLYKPFGVLSQFSSNNKKQLRTKKFLSDLGDFPNEIMPIGRLDEKSEGLLLLTTDGKLSDTINRSGIEKEYYAQLDGIITSDEISLLQQGVEIGFNGKRYTTKPCTAAIIETPTGFPEASPKLRVATHRPNSWIRICITEGKFRQIRKMTAAVGFPTLRLIRVRIGTITLAALNEGESEAIKDVSTRV